MTGASGTGRTAPAGSSRLATALACGTSGGADVSLAAEARLCAATPPCIMMVRPTGPASAARGARAVAFDVAGGTGTLGAAAGAEGGGATADSHPGGTAFGELGVGGDGGFAGGAAGGLAGGAAGGFAGGAAGGLAGAAAAGGFAGDAAAGGFAGGAAAGGFAASAAAGLAGTAAAGGFVGDAAAGGFAAGAAAGEAFCLDSDVVASAGFGNPAGMAKGGGAASPTMVLRDAGLSISFPVVGQVRVSGRCCFSQWGQGFAARFTAGSASRAALYPD